MTTKSKDFLASQKFVRDFLSLLGRMIMFICGVILALIHGCLHFIAVVNKQFDIIWMEEKGTVPEPYMYPVLWAALILALLGAVIIMKLLLPDPLLEVIDTILGAIVTGALFIATIKGLSLAKKKS